MAVHPPKRERFDLATQTNLDPKGVTRHVDEYRLEPFGLYLARPAPGRAQFHYLESWILPELNLRVTDFWFTPGHERDQDLYLDIVDVETAGENWWTTDLYLDLVLHTGRRVNVVDTDELLAATVDGLVSQERARRALETVYTTVESLSQHGYDLTAWLATRDTHLTWRRPPPTD